MASEGAPTDGSMREAARLALSSDWTLSGALAALGGEDVPATIAAYEASMAPLGSVERLARSADGGFGPGFTALRQALKLIGMKIAPTMSAQQCDGWLSAVSIALSDFPAKVAVQAARAALHVPMSFLNEVDGHVRAEAVRLMERHDLALRRLRSMAAEIERAARPANPQLAAPAQDQRLTGAEIRALSGPFLRIGLEQGWVTQDEVDAAIAEAADEQAAA